MKLSKLIKTLEKKEVRNFQEADVTGIAGDSRTVARGHVFVALKGLRADGHQFIDEALEGGAIAVVTETPVTLAGATTIWVEDTGKALALLASQFHGNPSNDLHMVGVTGTNGKTSTVHLFQSICEVSSWGKMGVIGTVGHGVSGELKPSQHTTPEPTALHRLLKDMREVGCVGVVMEISSHAVRQQRVWGIDFEIGMLTNITRDHLDFHPTFEDYVSAKREFCYSLVSVERKKKNGVLIYSSDDPIVNDIGKNFSGARLSTSVCGKADVYATGINATLGGTRFTLHTGGRRSIDVNMKVLGEFTVANAVIAAAAAREFGIGLEGIKSGLEEVVRVPGRFEAIGGGGRPLVIVDYCHTPDSLERMLKFCLDLEPRRLITVFGCGGDRDRGKRPLMGEIAQRYSHVCYVTSDNPRTEDPRQIIDEILAGMDRNDEGIFVNVDRRKAIQEAIMGAEPGDLIAVCGKGHEDYQVIGTTRHHFDDREEAEQALKEWAQIENKNA